MYLDSVYMTVQCIFTLRLDLTYKYWYVNVALSIITDLNVLVILLCLDKLSF